MERAGNAELAVPVLRRVRELKSPVTMSTGVPAAAAS